MNKLVLYHGTDCLFEHIDLNVSKDKRDFGRGFYTTTISAQAESWAHNMRIRRHSENAFVYEYELTLDDELSIRTFDDLTIEWLDFVKENRSHGGLLHDFDIVMGPVANDNTLLTVNRYIQGVYSPEEAIQRLAYFRANDQVSLHTARAIDHLKLKRRYRLE